MEYFYNLGNAYSQKELYPEAIAQYKFAIESLSGFSDHKKRAGPAYFNMGNAYFFIKDYKKAAEAFKNALEDHPKNKDYHFN
jgi:tetratricopeptide (TPR) repeat protein